MNELRGGLAKNPAAITKNHESGIGNPIVRQKGKGRNEKVAEAIRKSRNKSIFKYDPYHQL